jgi:hypothetical protein
MSRTTFERLRLPAALVLLAIAVFVLFPRGEEAAGPGSTVVPSASVVVGEPGGEVVGTATPATTRTPIPTLSPIATPTPRPTPTPLPPSDGFSAEVLACRSISGDRCNGQLGTLRPNERSFTALVRFTAANAGDTMNAILEGPAGRIDGFPYTLGGGGDGYYYTTFTAAGLPAGSYTLSATRNGEVVATTSFRKVGG